MDTGERQWRVFYTRARAEKNCETRLDNRGVEVLCPKQKVVRQWSDRTKEVVEPLFRNYLFAYVTERERLQVLRTNGIVRCVHFHGQPATLRPEVVADLKKAQSAPNRLSVVDLRPPVGTTVTITDGPLGLRGLTGELYEHRGQTSVLVRVDLLRQAVRVQVPGDWVVPEASHAA